MLRPTVLPYRPNPGSSAARASAGKVRHCYWSLESVIRRNSKVRLASSTQSSSRKAAPTRLLPRLPSTGGAYSSYADSLARRPAPTLLYRSLPMRSFTIGTYVVGFAAGLWGVHHGDLVFTHTQGMSPLIWTAYGGLCLFMFSIALWQFQRVRHIPLLIGSQLGLCYTVASYRKIHHCCSIQDYWVKKAPIALRMPSAASINEA